MAIMHPAWSVVAHSATPAASLSRSGRDRSALHWTGLSHVPLPPTMALQLPGIDTPNKCPLNSPVAKGALLRRDQTTWHEPC